MRETVIPDNIIFAVIAHANIYVAVMDPCQCNAIRSLSFTDNEQFEVMKFAIVYKLINTGTHYEKWSAQPQSGSAGIVARETHAKPVAGLRGKDGPPT